MIDITHKSNSLRYAKAQAVVRMSMEATALALSNNKVPKGNVLEIARAAALFAVKKTSEIIPDCHPLPVEYAAVNYQLNGLELFIEMEVKTIYKTGVEVEAMHGASVAALTVYDMLKPIDNQLEISSLKLLEKRGGKSAFKEEFLQSISAAVVVCSDSVANGSKSDESGKSIVNALAKNAVATNEYVIVPDEVDAIQNQVQQLVSSGINMIILTGGTGLSPRDITPEAIRPLLSRPIPGIEEYIRDYGQQRMPYAMLSRSVAGMIGKTLVLALPGSVKGAIESMDALMPHILHIFRVQEAFRHD